MEKFIRKYLIFLFLSVKFIILKQAPIWRGILGLVWMLFFRHSISIIHHSSLITLKYLTCLAQSLNIFHAVYGPHTCHSVQPFFFFFPQYPNSLNPIKKEKKKPKLTEPSERRRRRRRRKKKKSPKT